MELDGYQVTEILGGVDADGDFAVLIKNRHGESKAIVLADESLVRMSDLLNQARLARGLGAALANQSQQSLAIDRTGSETVAVARAELRAQVDLQAPSTHGSFEIRLEGKDGRGVTLTMPHDELVRWRDSLSDQIDAFLKQMN